MKNVVKIEPRHVIDDEIVEVPANVVFNRRHL